jgi:hypothetical protein
MKPRWKAVTLMIAAAIAAAAIIRAERRVVSTTKPDNITIAVDRDGNLYWNGERLKDNDELCKRLESMTDQSKLGTRKYAVQDLCKDITAAPENKAPR